MSTHRRVALVSGSRADFGLLKTVCRAINAHAGLDLRLIATGTHLFPAEITYPVPAMATIGASDARAWETATQAPQEPRRTLDEIAAEFNVAATVEMQRANEHGRAADARSFARGVAGLTDAFESLRPDVVLILGDRIEAFAAASAASIMGVRVAHIHGGDRAEGIADEALRHAITKLAHIHLPATEQSAARIERMGEHARTIHIVGSPAIDDLESFPPMDDARFAEFGSPQTIVLHHPTGRADEAERSIAERLITTAMSSGPTLALHPNHDPGREGIMHAISATGVRDVAHLPRPEFIGLLRRARVLVGNSSAGLIECAALGTWAVNIGSRQAGRERAGNVFDVAEDTDQSAIARAIDAVLNGQPRRFTGPHPYGAGRAGERTAELLATLDFADHPVHKRNTY